jgi:ABC-2 type transport system ATP-binding protein
VATIEVEHLAKRYGSTVAVEDVTFAVTEGEIFGILGPNGAGKTTTVESIVGLRVPDAGTIRVLGQDPQADGAGLHEVVGVQLQESALPPKLRVEEAVRLYAAFYERPADADALLEVLGLSAKTRSYFKDLSGGQKQRLSIALALIGRPTIAVLDELTTGLDPQARRATWGLVEDVRARGVTILLVTHDMDEAQHLCDRVALVDSGRVVAIDSPERLAERTAGGKRVRFRPSAAFDESLLTSLPEVSGLEHHGEWMIATGEGELVNAVILSLHGSGITARDVATESGALEDAFLALVGHDGHHPDGDSPVAGPSRERDRAHRRRGWRAGVRRPGTRPPRAAFRRLVATEWLLALRQPSGLIAGLGIPVVLLIVFGTVPTMTTPQASLGGFSPLQVYMPTLIALSLTVFALTWLPATLASYRELGVLRRMSTTPVSPTWLLGAQVVLSLALFACAVLIVLIGGAVVFGARVSFELPGFVVSLPLAIAAMFSIGLWIASIARSQRVAGAIGALLFFPMLFFAGVWLPQQSMPSWLRTISRLAPVGAGVHTLDASMLSGSFPPVQPLLVMAVWAAVFGWLAVRMFRWE